MPSKKLAFTFAGLAAVCALLSYAASERVGGLRGSPTASAAARTPGPGYGSYLQIAGVQAMDYDAATKGARRDGDAWVLGDVDLEAVRAAAAAPEDLDRLAEADPRWIPTQTWKLRHGGASPFALAKEHCSARHLAQMEGMCKADLSVVVERRGAGEGHVVYARPTLGDDATDDCHAYADCIARNAWLDRPTPLPTGSDTYRAFQAGDIRLPMHGTREEWQTSLRAEIEVVSDNLTALRRLDLADPQMRQSLDLQQDLLEQLEWMASL
ncbi:hypothetical protein [Nannocystis pusilla]|uniref:Uncharacterized protein n=1 Tax=Nannocystis pusilla TaxID=889268 RepID=A0ABS7U6B5_9BACT|nr:hypothetical protein [Nannocystis pusilla]MBZ5715983.1 hypothetical protein [Nannocystis pusilla]